jgi:hypothetical protein
VRYPFPAEPPISARLLRLRKAVHVPLVSDESADFATIDFLEVMTDLDEKKGHDLRRGGA